MAKQCLEMALDEKGCSLRRGEKEKGKDVAGLISRLRSTKSPNVRGLKTKDSLSIRIKHCFEMLLQGVKESIFDGVILGLYGGRCLAFQLSSKKCDGSILQCEMVGQCTGNALRHHLAVTHFI
ncbi:hypothetical protein KIN20_034994 [Parelaphostrongylus tenuis]|uniref:Uncharacterized protein n=1 Tax=Parelaphostrongylus tenuis TaxID=148309 RepID=A0AAD5RB14_PARTN|nr:hypothetical protein KIN20_034994 [Parelaphostrongylus tenuis]